MCRLGRCRPRRPLVASYVCAVSGPAQYPPSVSVLKRLGEFCEFAFQNAGGTSLSKPVAFVLALVHRFLSGGTTETGSEAVAASVGRSPRTVDAPPARPVSPFTWVLALPHDKRRADALIRSRFGSLDISLQCGCKAFSLDELLFPAIVASRLQHADDIIISDPASLKAQVDVVRERLRDS